MEKKKYIIPECEIVEMETVYMSSTSFKVETGGDGSVEEDNDVNEMGSNRHRGEWGNLWSDWGEK